MLYFYPTPTRGAFRGTDLIVLCRGSIFYIIILQSFYNFWCSTLYLTQYGRDTEGLESNSRCHGARSIV
jgi:hypothetical protein